MAMPIKLKVKWQKAMLMALAFMDARAARTDVLQV
eukprot:CAMPEP_0206599036 /NCGR_PEP_ID=MMETSP0325_2-20121206/44954_1 /ASSEMBLY_ACC=CAM_ASM_000347 /TAXON_ID=2866 /ORGANISM="Crypthecodinium cohnii, Strain Seligo" /LENGTH=34 /DNA_ID= /DNA_START= /DNA_END= /DNA_ORIENTATION=